MTIKATLIPGDGVGPEIVGATLRVLEAMGSPFEFETRSAGFKAFQETGSALPDDTVDSIRANGLALKGPLATPSAGGYRSATVQMREKFDLFANVRPSASFVPGFKENVDLVLVRENLQGMYAAVEGYIPINGDPHGVAFATAYNTMDEMIRILRYAIGIARTRERRKVTVVHKANIIKSLSGIMLEAAERLREEAAGVEIDGMIADAFGAKLVSRPERFDVVVTTNLFGDLFSDIAAEVVGGLGTAGGANIGKDVAIFEAVHGTADDIAGTGIVNPTSIFLSTAMMLNHVGEHEQSKRLENAVKDTIRAGQMTGDIGGSMKTVEFTDAVISRING